MSQQETAASGPTPTPGSTDLSGMLRTLSPALDSVTYVFCTFAPGESRPSGLPIKCLYEEAEGTTIITPRESAVALGVPKYFFPCRCVTLTVHSSLEAVGLLAAVTTHLAQDVKVGVNPVSAFYHDHLFVPLGREDEVMQSLRKLRGIHAGTEPY